VSNKPTSDNSQVRAVQGRDLADVEADAARAAEELHRLRGEQDALATERRAVAEERDAWRLAEIDGRALSLREEADAAQARLCRLNAERARLQLPAAEAQAAAARGVYDRAHAESLKAHALTNRLGVESDNAAGRALRLRQAVAENVRQALELERGLPPHLRGVAVRQS
jgi:hypothetical protein